MTGADAGVPTPDPALAARPPSAEAATPDRGGDGLPASETPDGPTPRASRRGAGVGLGVFTIEGRQAPGLFVVGWLATIMGVGLLFVGLLSGGGTAALVLLAFGLALLTLGLIAGAGSQAIERRASDEAGYTGPSPFLVFAAVIPATLLLQALVFVPLVALGLDAASPLAALIGLLLTTAVYLGLLRLLVVGTASLSWREMGLAWFGRASVVDLLYGAVLGVPLVFLSGLLALLLSRFLAAPDSVLPEAVGPLGALLNLASAALIAPIAEEVFFRGYATTAWLRTLGADRAVVRGAIFFAAAHVLTVGGATFSEGAERALFAFIVRLPVALALGWIFVRRGSLVAAIGLHAAYNAVPMLVLLASR